VGVLGIVLPLLPTTPFLLFAAACYARSSERLYCWLHQNRWFGAYLTNYRAGRGLPLRAKLATILILWVAISISIIVTPLLWLRVLLLAIAGGVTLHLLRMKTAHPNGRAAASPTRAGFDHSTS
jgi:uncharacterized membrane protein YbaN (DUF454 family)